jgi:hypothetical protein
MDNLNKGSRTLLSLFNFMFIVLVLTVLISNLFVYDLAIQQASGIKHMNSSPHTSNEDGALPSHTSYLPSPEPINEISP